MGAQALAGVRRRSRGYFRGQRSRTLVSYDRAHDDDHPRSAILRAATPPHPRPLEAPMSRPSPRPARPAPHHRPPARWSWRRRRRPRARRGGCASGVGPARVRRHRRARAQPARPGAPLRPRPAPPAARGRPAPALLPRERGRRHRARRHQWLRRSRRRPPAGPRARSSRPSDGRAGVRARLVSLTVAVAAANLRARPDRAAPLLATLSRRTPLALLGVDRTGTWARVATRAGRVGWIARYLTRPASLPPARLDGMLRQRSTGWNSRPVSAPPGATSGGPAHGMAAAGSPSTRPLCRSGDL